MNHVISAEYLTSKAKDSSIPEHMIEGLVAYIMRGRPVGHFLTAILTNDLYAACNRADEENQKKIYNYIFFLHNYAPMGCFGSLNSVKAWLEHQGMLFRQKAELPYE